jgi:RNA polymerase sigma factor (TIGR02999 family)
MPSPSDADADVTRLLRASRDGDASAHEALLGQVYGAMRGLASRLLSRERNDHTLQATELVHEAWFRLAPQGTSIPGEDRSHFLAITARAMRQVLVNHARDRARLKRKGPDAEHRVTLGVAAAEGGLEDVDVLALHEALEELRALDERQHAITELRVFGGLTVAETAEVLGVSSRTVNLDWSMARSFLAGRLGEGAD